MAPDHTDLYLCVRSAKNGFRCATSEIDARYSYRDHPDAESKYAPRVYDTTPDSTPEPTPTPTPVSTPTPLKSRVVKHQPDQFRKGAISKEELSAIKKAIRAIPWSRNSDPKAAADEDYGAILKECEKSRVHDLLTDLITEAVSNDYQPNNVAANGAYFTELNSDFEKRCQDRPTKPRSPLVEVNLEKSYFLFRID